MSLELSYHQACSNKNIKDVDLGLAEKEDGGVKDGKKMIKEVTDKIDNYLNEKADENDTKQAKYWVDEQYLTINLKENKLIEIMNKFVYSLPKKYSNKKEIIQKIQQENPKYDRKDVKNYIDSLDESRLEELVGFFIDSIKKWGHLS